MNYPIKLAQFRRHLASVDAAGAILTHSDNVAYLTGFRSVMDGWHLLEPISAVFVPTDPAAPVTLFLPEASLIALVTSEREGVSVFYEQLRTYDMLNFCVMARANDAHLELPNAIIDALSDITGCIAGSCSASIILAIGNCLSEHVCQKQTVLFDDLRVATHVHDQNEQSWGDALDIVLATRAVKTSDEIAILEQSGVIADGIIKHTTSQLGIGKRWCDVEKSVAKYMIDHDVDPLPGSPLLFGGAYDLVFRPDLFRTPYDLPFRGGEIAILETQGRYRSFWIDINRTAFIGTPSQAYRDKHQHLMTIYNVLVERLKPGVNTAELCRIDNIPDARYLNAPEKLLVVAHSLGHVPLESPVSYPGTGLHGATVGFEVQAGMAISIDCLYFGSKLGPSHMENVYIVTDHGSYSLYKTPLDLIEVS